jgi:hypothetical protein
VLKILLNGLSLKFLFIFHTQIRSRDSSENPFCLSAGVVAQKD